MPGRPILNTIENLTPWKNTPAHPHVDETAKNPSSEPVCRWLRSYAGSFGRACHGLQTATAPLGGHAAPGPFENHGFGWFHNGVRARVALNPCFLFPSVLGLEQHRISPNRSKKFLQIRTPGRLEGLPGDPSGLDETVGTRLRAFEVDLRCYPGSKIRLSCTPESLSPTRLAFNSLSHLAAPSY